MVVSFMIFPYIVLSKWRIHLHLSIIWNILNINIRPCDLVAFMPYLTKFFLKEALLTGNFQLTFWITYHNSLITFLGYEHSSTNQESFK